LPLLSNHDRSQFETFVYANVAKPDAMTRRLHTYADHWRDIAGIADAQVAQQIREDQVDVLVDISLHLARNRLLVFAYKPAPVQVTWLGYPGSTGLEAMDYRMSDPHLDPMGANDAFYSEKTHRLPDSFWCYDPHGDQPEPNELPASNGAPITFGCLNNFCKVNEPMLELWARIMREVPGSKLLLLADPGSHWQRTTEKLQSMGVDPTRVEFAPKRPREQYLELFHHIDLMLDTFPYNGHTTSLDSFWMGVPVVTLLGQPAVSRAGLCLATNLGLTELVAQNAQDYVRLAIDLALDLPRLAALRSTLRPRMRESPLMDGVRFARNMEHAFRTMWLRWISTQPR
jgi:predicted O-linked N-acetylglucosamine transferase (SPINDLY family)